MSWFDDIFLQSIFERCEPCKEKWLTAKQTECCIKNMELHTTSIETLNGHYRHDNYKYNWKGREVLLSYSKKNGCSTIVFGMTEDEKEQSLIEWKAEKMKQIAERATRTKLHNPERYANRIKSIKAKIKDMQDYINECIEDDDTEGLENLYDDVAAMSEELKIWESV